MVCNVFSLTLINETLLSTTERTFRETARISAYLTIFINASLLAFMLVVIFATAWFFTTAIAVPISKENYLAAIRNFILCYIVYEMFKMIIAWLFLTDVARANIGNPDFINTVNNSSWGLVQKTFDIIFIFGSPVVFGLTLKQRENLKPVHTVLISIPVLFILLILNKGLFV
jgi:hypothetical protein